MTPKEIFATALNAKPGEKIVINCATMEEADSLRTSLYRERGRYAKYNPEDAQAIIIKRKQDGDLVSITIKRVEKTAVIYKISADGEKEKLGITSAEEHPDLLRGIKLMKEEGAPAEDIEMFKDSWLKEYNDGLKL